MKTPTAAATKPTKPTKPSNAVRLVAAMDAVARDKDRDPLTAVRDVFAMFDAFGKR